MSPKDVSKNTRRFEDYASNDKNTHFLTELDKKKSDIQIEEKKKLATVFLMSADDQYIPYQLWIAEN